MNEREEESIKAEIKHIFDSGANEMRIFEMIKNLYPSIPKEGNYIMKTPEFHRQIFGLLNKYNKDNEFIVSELDIEASVIDTAIGKDRTACYRITTTLAS